MTKAPVGLQDLRRRIYVKAKAEPSKRFWGLYVHVCKTETINAAYQMAKANAGAPGIDGVTFEAIEESGVEVFVAQIRDELVSHAYRPMRNRKVEIPKDDGKIRVLSIPAIRDRVVQGALKLILEPIFETDFQEGSYGYRPKRTAHDAVARVLRAILLGKTQVIDLDLRAYFDNVRHDVLLMKMAKRIDDDDVMHLLKLMLKVTGTKGVPQGGVISPLLSNIYLNEVDQMLERARETTRHEKFTRVEYARFADDIVILLDLRWHGRWLQNAVTKRLREELAKLHLELNEEKTRVVDTTKNDSFGFLGFDFRRIRRSAEKPWVRITPKLKKRTALLRKLALVFQRHRSQPTQRLIAKLNPILRGWANYFRVGNSGRCFHYVQDWVERKVRRHMMRSRGRQGFGWERWSKQWLYSGLGLYGDYKIRTIGLQLKALPIR